ncbi:MAG: prepilin-type N-terminal cleavage/methylation domain-containing protein [Syntrophobacterales bacterium]|nr:MAG: prepilin-type N-terminal cleavage/methylation domain-containing protein [Syntrophobacterales bacterium]
MNRWLIKNKGFTLMEVLIAIVVLSVALLALAGLQIISIRGNSFGNHMTEAITLAKDLMEEMKNAEWEDIEDRDDDPIGSSGITYHRECRVAEAGRIRTVTVRVSWDNDTHRVTLVTNFADLRAGP